MGLAPDTLTFDCADPVASGYVLWTQMRDGEGNACCVLRGPGSGWSPDER